MPTITNHFTNVRVLKLTDEPGKHGPLIVVQSGVAPGDMTVRERMFLLCRDGEWADVVSLGAVGKPELWDAALFDTSTQVLVLLDGLDHKPRVKQIETSAEDIEAWLSRTANLDAEQRIQNLLAIYKKRLESKGHS